MCGIYLILILIILLLSEYIKIISIYLFIYLFEIENKFKPGIYSIIILCVCMVWFIW